MSAQNPFSKVLRAVHDGVLDGWENAVTLLGTAYSAVSYHQLVQYPFKPASELKALYHSDSFAGKTVWLIPKTAFRGGWTIVPPAGMEPGEAEEQRLRIEAQLWELGAKRKIIEAACWGRRDGRGAIWVGTVDAATQAEPLDPVTVRRVAFLDVLEADDFSARSYYADSLAPDFGEPATWTVTRTGGSASSQDEVHSSRLLLFESGIPTSRRTRGENEWRAESVLEAPYMKFRNLDIAMGMLVEMISTASQGVLKIHDLPAVLAENKTYLETRLRILDLARSVRIMPIDAGDNQGRGAEDFGYAERGTLAGMADIALRLAEHVAGAVGIPISIFFGSPPGGLTTEDTGSTRAWYDGVQAEREDTYRRPLEHLVYLLAISEGLDSPEEWGVSWPSLWQESPTEAADRRSKVAATDIAYLTAGVTTPEAVAIARYGSGEWSDAAPAVPIEELEGPAGPRPVTAEEYAAEEGALYQMFAPKPAPPQGKDS